MMSEWCSVGGEERVYVSSVMLVEFVVRRECIRYLA